MDNLLDKRCVISLPSHIHYVATMKEVLDIFYITVELYKSESSALSL